MSFDGTLPPPDVYALPLWVRAGLAAPLPGSEPDQIRRCASGLRAGAGLLRSALEQLHRMGSPQTFWSGSAADEFAALVRAAPRHIGAVATRYEGYAGVLLGYAEVVESTRIDVRRDSAALQTAWSAWQSGRDSDLPAATAACVSAYTALRQDYQRWRAAAHAAARALSHIDDHDPLQNPQGLHALADAVSGVSGQLSQVCAAIGVICILVCPVAAPIFLAASAAFSAVQLAADVDRAVQFHEPVSAMQFATDAIGTVPFSGVGRAGIAGFRSARGATGVGTRMVKAAGSSARSVARTVQETATTATSAARELVEVGPRAAFGQALGPKSLTALGQNWEDVVSTEAQNLGLNSSLLTGLGQPVPIGAVRPLPGARVSVDVDTDHGESVRVTITVPAGPPDWPVPAWFRHR